MSSTQEVGDIFGQGRGSAQAMLRSPTVLILCVGLWGMNLFFYRLFGIDYKYVLNYDLIEIDREEKEKARTTSSSSCTSSSTSNRSLRSSSRIRSGGYSDAAPHDLAEPPGDLELMESSNGNSINTNGNNSGSSSSSSKPMTSPSSAAMTKKLKARTSPQTDGIAADLAPPQSPLQLPPQQQQQPLDFGAAVVWYKLVLFSVVLLFLLHTSTHYWMDHLRRSSIGAVFFFYLCMVLYIFVPLKQNVWLRRSFVIVLKRVWALIHPRCSCIVLAGTSIPPRRVPFVDVFFADAMCSLSKVFFDWGMLAHQAIHYPHPVPAATHNIVVPSLCAALPYLIRARQCLVMHTVGRLKRCPKKHQHLMNAFKYSTSMYPLILSAYLQTFSAQDNTVVLEKTLTVLLIINASYSLYWDIVMDWGMMQDPYKVAQTACAIGVPVEKGHPNTMNHHRFHKVCLRPSLRFGLTLTVLIVVADSFLRFSWVLKFVPRLFPSNDAFVLCTQFLEVFRRAIWNLLRVEWENIKQRKHHSSSGNDESSSLQPQQQQQLIPSPLSLGSSIGGGDVEDLKESALEMKPLR
jgi:hypothetical protein